MNLLSRRTAPRLSYGHSSSAAGARVSGPPSASCTGMLPRDPRIERRIEAEVGQGGVPAHVRHGWTTSHLRLEAWQGRCLSGGALAIAIESSMVQGEQSGR